jgi:hypothetical protein
MISLNGCALLNEQPPRTVAEAPDLPELQKRLIAGCPDLPITGEAISDLLAHRLGYAKCKSLQREVVAFHLDTTRLIEDERL